MTWLREPMRPLSSEQLVLSASFLRAEEHDGDYVLSDEANKALNECLNSGQGQGPSDDELNTRIGHNVYRLDEEFDAIGCRRGCGIGCRPRTTPTVCVTRALTSGGSRKKESASFTNTRLTLETEQPPASDKIPVGDEPVSAEWREVPVRRTHVVGERRGVSRGRVRHRHRAHQATPAGVRSGTRQQLINLDSHWEGILAEAVNRGFSPSGEQAG